MMADTLSSVYLYPYGRPTANCGWYSASSSSSSPSPSLSSSPHPSQMNVGKQMDKLTVEFLAVGRDVRFKECLFLYRKDAVGGGSTSY